MNTGKIDRTVNKALDMVEKLEKLFANNGAFENAVIEIGGDISYFGDVRRKLVALYGEIEDLHMGAIGHMDESVTESVKLTEGVLDGDDEDGFMARSQLYFLARDAISLHGMISDRDNLEPWVQSKITTAANDIEAVRRYTEYNQQQADRQLPVPAEEPAPDMEMEEGWESMPAIDAERYGPRDGLEGPFQTRVGKVVYYDPKAGKYYDPDSDHYLEYDEWKALDKPGTPLRNEAVNEAKNPYAIGMAQAMKSTGDTPPLSKSTIKKAHKIAKAVKGESVTEAAYHTPRFAFINDDDEIEIWNNIAKRHIRSIPMQNKQSAIQRLKKANYEASLDTFKGYQMWYMNTEPGIRFSDYDPELEEAGKPDFLDLDKDGNKKEPMKKAAKDAKKKPVEEGMNFDDNRDGALKQIAADMFSHAKKSAAKKVK